MISINAKLKSLTMGLFLIAFLAGIMYFLSFFKPSTDDCSEEKEMSFRGIITGILSDSFNKAQKIILLNNREKIIPPFTYGLWNEVNVGDSIVKEKGTLNYIIYKNGIIDSEKILLWDRKCDYE